MIRLIVTIVGTSRAATTAAMVREDHRSGVFDANESCHWVT